MYTIILAVYFVLGVALACACEYKDGTKGFENLGDSILIVFLWPALLVLLVNEIMRGRIKATFRWGDKTNGSKQKDNS